jgi:septal ring factor EnvC (AmiA/AmiB activator)
MGKKKMIIILAALAAVSFGVSFGVSTLTKKSKPAPATAPADEAKAAESSVLPPELAQAVPSLSTNDKQVQDWSRELRAKLEEVKKRQQDLDQRERRVAIAEDSLKKDVEKLEEARIRLMAPLDNLRKAQDDLKASRVAISAQEAANLKRLATVFEKMDAVKGGAQIESMCSNKQEDDAAKILHYMSDRGAAKVMDEMADKTLKERLLDKMKKITEEA